MTEGFRDLLNRMNHDEVSLLCKTDSLIREFGERLFLKLGGEQHQRHHIGNKMRELGRLLHELQREDSGARLEDYLQSPKFLTIVQATKEISKYDNDVNKYGAPSLAMKLGQDLKKCGKILKARKLQSGEDTTSVNDFMDLLSMDWNDSVSRRARTTLEEERWNKEPLIPLTEDLHTLQRFLDAKMETLKQKLTEHPTTDAHKAYGEVVLTRLILFNRRRQGEAGRVSVDALRKADHVEMTSELKETLSPLENHLSNSLSRVVIKGKRGRGVPLLLTPEVRDGMELLVTTREQIGVDNSPYVFVNAASPRLHPLRGSDCMRKIAEMSGVQRPGAITSTSLRKHVATVSQVLNMKDHEMDSLARFMGHDIRVHRNFYRMPDPCTQVVKISKLLIAAETGLLHRNLGKTLEEMDLEDDSQLPSPDVPAPEAHAPEVLVEVSAPRVPAPQVPAPRVPAPQVPAPQVAPQVAPQLLGTHQETGRTKVLGATVDTVKKKKKSWTETEKNAVQKHLKLFIVRQELPGKSACIRVKEAEEVLKERTWTDIKNWVRNTIISERRKLQQTAGE